MVHSSLKLQIPNYEPWAMNHELNTTYQSSRTSRSSR